MKSRRSCWSILLFLGSSHALLIDILQDSVNGTISHSVFLPVSYRLQEPFPFPLSIQWHFSNSLNPLTTYTVTNCSVSAEGIPIHCSGNNFIHSEYQGRTVFFPENASLLLQNLQLSDSGVYSITFKVPQQTRHITLTVSEPHFNHGNTGSGAVQQRRTRIIKQEEVPNHEESHMESSSPRTVSTIYAKIGEEAGQRQRRSESQTEYASLIFS
ncbi:unnamed protein product [Caretta caretta]